MSDEVSNADATPSLRVIVVDDEPLIREGLRDMLAGLPGVQVIDTCANAEHAFESITRLNPDAIFLDIEMPGANGMELARRIVEFHSRDGASHAAGSRKSLPAIVFATAYNRYAVDAFEVEAVDYLLKPFDVARVMRVMDRVRARRAAMADSNEQATELRAFVSGESSANKFAERLLVSLARGSLVVPVGEIEWMEADDNYITVHSVKGAGLVRGPLKTLEARLDPAVFVRVHRAAVVNIRRIDKLRARPSGDYEITMGSGAKVTMSRSHRDAVLRLLG